MLRRILLGLGIVAAVAATAAFAARQAFVAHIDGLERRLAERAHEAEARGDLPPQVRALAHRLGAREGATARTVSLAQSGVMRQTPDAAEMRFTARQTMSAAAPEFVWRASFAPLGAIIVVDYFVDGEGGLDGRLLGAIPVVRVVGGDLAAKGELMRYLAELPWVPDAILANRALDWRVIDDRTLAVATGTGDRRAEVNLLLDEEGLVAAIEAEDRPSYEDGVFVERPWRGRFTDYRNVDGRRVPTRAEVAWVLDGEEFVYWRGALSGWTAD